MHPLCFIMHVTLLRSSHCNWKLQFHPQPWNVTTYVFSIMSLDRKKEYKTPSPSPWHPSSSSFFLHFACLKIALDHLILFWNVWKLGSRLVSNYPFGCLSKIAIEKLFFLVKLENKLQKCYKGTKSFTASLMADFLQGTHNWLEFLHLVGALMEYFFNRHALLRHSYIN